MDTKKSVQPKQRERGQPGNRGQFRKNSKAAPPTPAELHDVDLASPSAVYPLRVDTELPDSAGAWVERVDAASDRLSAILDDTPRGGAAKDVIKMAAETSDEKQRGDVLRALYQAASDMEAARGGSGNLEPCPDVHSIGPSNGPALAETLSRWAHPSRSAIGGRELAEAAHHRLSLLSSYSSALFK